MNAYPKPPAFQRSHSRYLWRTPGDSLAGLHSLWPGGMLIEGSGPLPACRQGSLWSWALLLSQGETAAVWHPWTQFLWEVLLGSREVRFPGPQRDPHHFPPPSSLPSSLSKEDPSGAIIQRCFLIIDNLFSIYHSVMLMFLTVFIEITRLVSPELRRTHL